MAQIAAAEGLPYAKRTHWYNSVPAHEAALWADEQGQGEEFRRAVYRAYFADGLNIGSTDVLAGLAENLRLHAPALRAALSEDRYRQGVEDQFEIARANGITGVPTYVAGGYYMVGAQPDEMFRKLIETVLSESPPFEVTPGS
jgi:predicted DsbA family dithiol-disulfide isomerase